MKVKGPVWLGIHTSNFNTKVNSYQNIRGLDIPYQEPGLVVMHLADGGRIEFADDANAWAHFHALDMFISDLTYTPDPLRHHA